MSEYASQPNPEFLSISYSLQRNVTPQQSSIVSLMISAASTELPKRIRKNEQSSFERWSLGIVGTLDHSDKTNALFDTLNNALSLASIDNVSRSLYNSRGICVSKNCESVAPKDFDPLLSLIAQITDLKHYAQTPARSDSSESNEKTTSPELVEAQEFITQDTRPIDLSKLANTIDVEEDIKQINSTKSSGHLLLICTKPLESISPTILASDLSSFDSITLLYQGAMDHVLSWLRWSAQMGASLILNTDRAVQQLANRFQAVSRQVKRQGIHVSSAPGFVIVSMTQLTPQPGPIPFEANERSARDITCWINLPPDDQRWSMMINLKRVSTKNTQPTLSFNQEGQALATIHVGDITQMVTIPTQAFYNSEQRRAESRAQSQALANPLNEKLPPRFDSNLRGVAFAQQLAHRVRVIDNLVLSLLRKELRKSAKLLDQLLRVTSTLQGRYEVDYLRQLKVKLLATGQLDEDSKSEIITKMTQSTHQLSLNGYWIASKK